MSFSKAASNVKRDEGVKTDEDNITINQDSRQRRFQKLAVMKCF